MQLVRIRMSHRHSLIPGIHSQALATERERERERSLGLNRRTPARARWPRVNTEHAPWRRDRKVAKNRQTRRTPTPDLHLTGGLVVNTLSGFPFFVLRYLRTSMRYLRDRCAASQALRDHPYVPYSIQYIQQWYDLVITTVLYLYILVKKAKTLNAHRSSCARLSPPTLRSLVGCVDDRHGPCRAHNRLKEEC